MVVNKFLQKMIVACGVLVIAATGVFDINAAFDMTLFDMARKEDLTANGRVDELQAFLGEHQGCKTVQRRARLVLEKAIESSDAGKLNFALRKIGRFEDPNIGEDSYRFLSICARRRANPLVAWSMVEALCANGLDYNQGPRDSLRELQEAVEAVR
jgi:hypothetical protein